MANRFKKMIQPLLDEARNEGYKAGHDDGMNDGFREKTLAYENEIKFLKVLVERLRAKPIVPGPEMADPNIMELYFHNGERHMKEKVILILDAFDKDYPYIDYDALRKAMEGL